MKYRALITIRSGRGIIYRKGDDVPSTYPRLEEALGRGWVDIVREHDRIIPGHYKPKEPSKAKSETKPAKVAEPEEPAEDAEEPETQLPAPVPKDMTVDEVGRELNIQLSTVDALRDYNIKLLSDLKGYSVEKLVEIRGVGNATAVKLLEKYSEVFGEVLSD